MENKNADTIRDAVRERYGNIARTESPCCNSLTGPSCCGPASGKNQNISMAVGYSEDEIQSVPAGANLGLGCGNPVGLAAIQAGDTVLDLGSGAGFDAFLAAREVGEDGKVIGVDMTAEMVTKARENARKAGFANVEFRLGEIENLPAADSSVDLILSNCVINLSPDKERVFAETYRVLKPGGRVMISDIVLQSPLPEVVKNSIEAYVGCLAGATLKEEYLAMIASAGFEKVEVAEEGKFAVETASSDPIVKSFVEETGLSRQAVQEAGQSVLSIRVSAVKPETE